MSVATIDTASPRRRFVVSRMALKDRLTWLSVFASFFVMFEPSPNEIITSVGLILLLALGIHLPRAMLPPIWLLLILNVGGILSALPIFGKPYVPTFVVISVFLMAYCIYFLILFADNTLRRFDLLRSAWIWAGLIAAVCGIMGYFNVAGTRDLFTLYATRAKGTFNDPNVFGPYLVLPIVMTVQAVLTRTSRRPFLESAICLVLVLGLFLSFSRATWAHLVLSLALLIALLILTTRSTLLRTRITLLVIVGAFALALVLIALTSVPEVQDVFAARASLNQDYDTRAGGRFDNLRRAIDIILVHPNGIGPHEFGRRFGEDPHNAYIHTFVAYGWAGGLAYAGLVASTLWVGWRNVFARTVYQPAMIACLATFTVLCGIGMVIHSDHWRHFYLLIALIWALAIATRRALDAAGSSLTSPIVSAKR